MRMTWHELLFMHWPIPAESLRPLVPQSLRIDTFDDQAWIGVVPFRMSGVTCRGLPALPWLSAFLELNVRTYVSAEGKPGVWFFSLDANHRLAVRTARRWFHLPYQDAEMSLRRHQGGIHYRSRRVHRGEPPAELDVSYRATGAASEARPESLEDFLTARYCLYAGDHHGKLFRGEILHAPWQLQPAEADVFGNTMVAPLRVSLPAQSPLLHYAHRTEVVAWSNERIV